jgi:hypothetical protein
METMTAPASVHQDMTEEPVNNHYFIGRLEDTLEAIRSNPRLNMEKESSRQGIIDLRISKLCSPESREPFCLVAKIMDKTDPKKPVYEYVESLDTFRAMLQSLDEPEKVETYCGVDASEVLVLTARLTSSYAARVSAVRFRHIPNQYKIAGQVLLREIGDPHLKRGQREAVHTCWQMAPPWTDLKHHEIPFEEMHRNYHCVTIKIRNDDGTIKSWNPGLDKDISPCMSLQDTFVLVGTHHEAPRPHYKKNLFKGSGKKTTTGLAKIPLV